MLRVAFRGNFSVPYATESHVSASMELLGHEVIRCQEDEVDWQEQLRLADGADIFWFTPTHGVSLRYPEDETLAAIRHLNDTCVTVFHHLDLWFGLDRAEGGRFTERPAFQVSHVFTADGDHDQEWAEWGVNHTWMPPGVYGPECVPGTYDPRFECDVAFVGSWQQYGHKEWWPQRRRLLRFLKATYGRRFKCFPEPGQPAVRGADLNNLYATAKVVVGDSCLVDRSTRYVSDRLMESLGRGACLVFPYLPVLEDWFEDGTHLRWWEYEDHQALKAVIDSLLADDDKRAAMKLAGQAEVRANHSYAVRVQQILGHLTERGAFTVPSTGTKVEG